MNVWVYLSLILCSLTSKYAIGASNLCGSETCTLKDWMTVDCNPCCLVDADPVSAVQGRILCCPDAANNDRTVCSQMCGFAPSQVSQNAGCELFCTGHCPNGFRFRTTTTSTTTTTTPTPTTTTIATTTTAVTTTTTTILCDDSNNQGNANVKNVPGMVSLFIVGVILGSMATFLLVCAFKKKDGRVAPPLDNEAQKDRLTPTAPLYDTTFDRNIERKGFDLPSVSSRMGNTSTSHGHGDGLAF